MVAPFKRSDWNALIAKANQWFNFINTLGAGVSLFSEVAPRHIATQTDIVNLLDAFTSSGWTKLCWLPTHKKLDSATIAEIKTRMNSELVTTTQTIPPSKWTVVRIQGTNPPLYTIKIDVGNLTISSMPDFAVVAANIIVQGPYHAGYTYNLRQDGSYICNSGSSPQFVIVGYGSSVDEVIAQGASVQVRYSISPVNLV